VDASRDLGDGRFQLELAVPAIHCGACIRTVETALGRLAGVDAARVNLSTQRVTVRWHGEEVPPVAATLAGIGYPPHIYDPSADVRDDVRAELLRAVAVSGFAAGNIMLLSVSVWSGADGATRDLFHWVSALIALPALAFAGRIYFRSAWSALRHGRLNMDVPITIGVSLAYAMSLYETVTHGPHAYFDASVTLLFFLLIGPDPGPSDARTGALGGRGARPTAAARGVGGRRRRHARIHAAGGTQARDAADDRRRGTSARGCAHRRGNLGARRLAGQRRERAFCGGRGDDRAGRHPSTSPGR
jgi:copper chaperone CopZ